MATVNLASDGYFISGDVNVNELIPLVVAAGTTANTYVLPGDVSVPAGSVFPGYQLGTKFTLINVSSNTQTIQAPTGYTLSGATSIGAGNTTPTRLTVFFIGAKTWVAF